MRVDIREVTFRAKEEANGPAWTWQSAILHESRQNVGRLEQHRAAGGIVHCSGPVVVKVGHAQELFAGERSTFNAANHVLHYAVERLDVDHAVARYRTPPKQVAQVIAHPRRDGQTP